MGYSKRTEQLIAEYEAHGYTIHHGNNPKMDQAQKWADHHLVRICQTNSTAHGFSKYTVWASKPNRWKLQFVTWVNPEKVNLTNYNPKQYAYERGIDYPGRYKNWAEAMAFIRILKRPDQHGVNPHFIPIRLELEDDEEWLYQHKQ